MKIGYTDDNDCDFTIEIEDDTQQKKTVECIQKGIEAWYAATNPETYKGDDFSKEDIDGFYWEGYAVPTCILLDRAGIKYELVEDEYDDNGMRVVDMLVNGF